MSMESINENELLKIIHITVVFRTQQNQTVLHGLSDFQTVQDCK